MFLVLAVVLVLAGCSTPQSRARANAEALAGVSPEVREKVLAGEVDLGFSEELVLVALGKPDRRYSRVTEEGASTIWAYRSRSPGSRLSFGVGTGIGIGGGGYGGVSVGTGGASRLDETLRIVFVEGRVVGIENMTR